MIRFRPAKKESPRRGSFPGPSRISRSQHPYLYLYSNGNAVTQTQQPREIAARPQLQGE